MSYDYYKATWSVVTARQARRLGVKVSRDYGYYVLIDPPVYDAGKLPGSERVKCWCKTKTIAEDQVHRLQEYQRLGYFGCPCGNDRRQAVACCGIPV